MPTKTVPPWGGRDDVTRYDVPDALWPTDNKWGVPLLDLKMQARAFDQPWAMWGSTKRKTTIKGTYLFYTEDYRYERLWKDPAPLLRTKCTNAVEPNFSCYENMPAAVALWQVYRKRWIARWWQSYGVRIIVDLNVARNHEGVNLLGVPRGWRVFATRGYEDRLEDTHREYAIADQIAGDNATPIFIVYGGGLAVKEACTANGWIWIAENMDVGKGRDI